MQNVNKFPRFVGKISVEHRSTRIECFQKQILVKERERRWGGVDCVGVARDLNEEAPVEYSYGTIDLNAEPDADVGFDGQASYGLCMTTVDKVTRRRVMKKSRRFQTLTGKPKRHPGRGIAVYRAGRPPISAATQPQPSLLRERAVESLPRAQEEEPPQHPPHAYRAVRLTEPLEALLHQIAAQGNETARQMARVERRLNHIEDLVQWTVASEVARRNGSQLPPLPEPRVYADDGSSAGPSGS
ncbi:hypothetical protein R6Q57_025461 [Mikania cordata]